MIIHDDSYDIPTEESSLLQSNGGSHTGDSSGQFLDQAEIDKNFVSTHFDLTASSPKISPSSIMILAPHTEDKTTPPSTTRSKKNRHSRRTSSIIPDKIGTSFIEDTKSLAEGTIPQSVVLAVIIGTVCGIACWIYYTVMFFCLDLVWERIPEKFIVGNWNVENYWLYIPIATTVLVTFVGLTVIIMGEPGDLPYTIGRVHNHAYIPIDHVLPMVFASLFSILAGGSLGPEAPLVAICGAIGGFISRNVFQQKHINVVRKHTFMGMSGALAAFFGAPMGGSIFALEVCSRFGIEYFEHLVESVFCGEICLVVFRWLSGLSIAPIWDVALESGRMVKSEPRLVLVGGILGLVGAFMAYIFATFHIANMSMFTKLGLLENSKAVQRAWLAGFFIILVGVLFPQTMFWGEEEIDVVANWKAASELPNVWPKTGYTGLEMNTAWTSLVVGLAKLVAISFTVAGGLRGGYIFPLMMAGTCFGRTLHAFLPDWIPLQLCVLCTAAGINVAITRTALASTLILSFLPGEPSAQPAILMASLCSLFATAYLPFIKSQITRSDIDNSLYYYEDSVARMADKVEQCHNKENHYDCGVDP